MLVWHVRGNPIHSNSSDVLGGQRKLFHRNLNYGWSGMAEASFATMLSNFRWQFLSCAQRPTSFIASKGKSCWSGMSEALLIAFIFNFIWNLLLMRSAAGMIHLAEHKTTSILQIMSQSNSTHHVIFSIFSHLTINHTVFQLKYKLIIIICFNVTHKVTMIESRNVIYNLLLQLQFQMNHTTKVHLMYFTEIEDSIISF